MLTEIKHNNFYNTFNKLKKLNNNINKFNNLINNNTFNEVKHFISNNKINFNNPTNNFKNVDYLVNYNNISIIKKNYIELKNEEDFNICFKYNFNLDINKYNNAIFLLKIKKDLMNIVDNKNFIDYKNKDINTVSFFNIKNNSKVLKQFNLDIHRFMNDIYIIIDNRYYLFDIETIVHMYGDKIEGNPNTNVINDKINNIINKIYEIKEFDIRTKNIIKYYFITLINQYIRSYPNLYYKFLYGDSELTGNIDDNIISIIDCDNLIAFQLCNFKTLSVSNYQPIINLADELPRIYSCEKDNICKYICSIIKFESNGEVEFIIFPYFDKAITHYFDKDLILNHKLISFINI